MILEFMAAFILLAALHAVGMIVFGAVGAVIGAAFSKDREAGAAKGTWFGLFAFWVTLFVFALAVVL